MCQLFGYMHLYLFESHYGIESEREREIILNFKGKHMLFKDLLSFQKNGLGKMNILQQFF